MYRCRHCRTVVELRNPAETIEAVAARLPGCDELRQQNDVTETEHHKASHDCLRLAKIGAEKLGITPEHIKHYARALARWTAAGMPMREQVEVERIEAICRSNACGQYVDGRCEKCGCCVNKSWVVVRNKIKMATESCPVGRW